jgi:hypothetical protein
MDDHQQIVEALSTDGVRGDGYDWWREACRDWSPAWAEPYTCIKKVLLDKETVNQQNAKAAIDAVLELDGESSAVASILQSRTQAAKSAIASLRHVETAQLLELLEVINLQALRHDYCNACKQILSHFAIQRAGRCWVG